MMKYRKILLLTILCLIVALWCGDAMAAESMLEKTAKKLTSTFISVKGIILIIGGFGLVGVTYYAIFGKVKWSWLAGILVGLAVLSATGALIFYATKGSSVGSSEGVGVSSNIFDFFSGRAINFAVGLRNVAFCLAGFGIIMFTFLAISGKINFKHLGYIFISLFLLSGVGLFISYWTGGHAELGALKQFASPRTFTEKGVNDTFSSSLSE